MDPFFRDFMKAYNFDDMFFICASHGHIMYTVLKEDDLGTNLNTGEYRNSNLAKLWKDIVVNKKPAMVDYSFYNPSNENAAFIGVPVTSSNNELIGVVAFQLSTNRINDIMNENTGLGETGESYLVGDDFLMRSDSRFIEESTILKQKVKTISAELGLKDKSGTHIINDYRGTSVLSYYSDLGLNEKFSTNFEWAIITEIYETEAFAPVNALMKKVFTFGFIIILFVMILSLFGSKYFTKPILKLNKIAQQIAGGDLTQSTYINHRQGEIGELAESIKMMRENLRKQMEEMTEGVNVLSSSSSEIMAMVAQLASGSAETATSISETSTTIEEVKQTAEVSAQKANEVSETAQKISMISQDGKKSVEETIEGMNKIKHQMESIAGIVIQLSEKSNAISEIANNVNDLAEQSNLLAVNASIEAAKAGEQGKGFSVVAQEIKNLAERSKGSTVQIRAIIADIQKGITSAVMATEQGGKVIDAGLDLSATASEVISTLAAGVEQTSEANMYIAASSQQQLTGMDQIATAMENIKEASTQTSEGTLQTEESVTELKNLGEKLLQIIKYYKLGN
jgi:methyl-accepting chemotaxis protein